VLYFIIANDGDSDLKGGHPMLVSELEPGAKFRCPFSGVSGTVVRIGTGSAVVRYGNRAASFTVLEVEGEKEVAFEAPGRPVTISLQTEVERCE
jgi:hypothetical protein